MNKKIVIDIGGTNTRVALMDHNYKKDDHISFNTDINNAEKTFSKIVDFINKYPKIVDVGISAPGPTDYKKGIFGEPVNVKWKGFNFFKFIKENTHIKNIKSDNDANLMALANHKYFKRGENDVTQFFTVSTGLGAGLIINNEIWHGTNEAAQEVAALPVAWIKKSGKELSEGALELFSSGSGIKFWGTKYGFKSTKEIFLSYKTSKKVQEIINNGIETLANAIATTASLINPNLFVFDGSVARHNKWYIEKAVKLSKTRMFKDQYENVEFKISELGDDSALVGAYELLNK